MSKHPASPSAANRARTFPEMLSKVVDGAVQAATCDSVTSAAPSMNSCPERTFSASSGELSRRHRSWAMSSSL
jgi:hypothetical protein